MYTGCTKLDSFGINSLVSYYLILFHKPYRKWIIFEELFKLDLHEAYNYTAVFFL